MEFAMHGMTAALAANVLAATVGARSGALSAGRGGLYNGKHDAARRP